MEHISALVWHGHVTVIISFHGHVYLLRARRNAYFPFYFPQIAAFFYSLSEHHLLHKSLWLQHLQTPLHWNLPVGVLRDMFCDPESPSWHLLLHAETAETPYPAQILPICPQTLQGAAQHQAEDARAFPRRSLGRQFPDALQHVFMNSLKQANYAMTGNSRAVMRLSNEDTRVLWESVVSNNYSHLLAIYAIIGPEVSGIPLKIYLDRIFMVQAPCRRKATLRQCLAPHIDLQQQEVWIHGIRASLMYELFVEEVWSRFHYLDMVMYVVARPMQAS